MSKKTISNLSARLAVAVMLSITVVACANTNTSAVKLVQQKSPIEGVWKITKPTPFLTPVSGDIPFTAEGKERYLENKKYLAEGTRLALDEFDIVKSRCSSPGVPRLMISPMRFKIWQQLDVVTFDFEWNRAIRQVEIRETRPELPLVPNINGVAIGNWQDQTLVVSTVDVSDKTLIDDLVPHSGEMKVTERYTLVDKNTLENRITIEDPVFFTTAWDAVVTYKRQADVIFPEDVCLDRLDAGQVAFPADIVSGN